MFCVRIFLDLFKGPTVEKIRTLGVEHQFHFVLSSDKNLCLRVRKITLSTKGKTNSTELNVPPLKTPDGKVVQITLEDATPSADFDLRRVSLPSEVSNKTLTFDSLYID